MRFPPANVQLRRAQLVLMMAGLAPTVAMLVVGIILLLLADDASALIAGILILTLCTTGVTGYILVSIFVGKGASLARVQNDFVSSVSHELRTPLTSMMLLLEPLRDDRLPIEDRRRVLDLLRRELGRLEYLVNRVLELSRLESGHHAFEKAVVSVDDLAKDAIDAYRAATAAQPTPVNLDLAPDLTVVGDRPTLSRAISNLLINAWKYTGDDKQITLSAKPHGRWIEIAVRDNGVGIPRSEKREIFDQFIRGQNAVDLGAPGIGLGLAFVRAIVRAHRGKVEVVSAPGAGTEFRLKLRQARGAQPAPASATTLASSS